MIVQNRESLGEFLDNILYHLISIERQPTSIGTSIRSLIKDGLSTGELPSFEEVAEMLKLSNSGLRRRLNKEDLSYSDIKEGVRRDIAIEQLLAGDTKVADIAEYLGYAESSSFVRSFKRWTGLTPSQYRANYQNIALELR
ncbi:MAG: helix-turn-helix domain-containing protein [Pseudomonadales bacterium]